MALQLSPSNIINGSDAWDFSSIEFVVGKVPFKLISDVNYTEGRTVGHLRGPSPHKLGRTRGVYDSSGSLTMYKKDFDLVLVPQLVTLAGGGGYMDADFDITMHFGMSATAGSTNVLKDCGITDLDDSYAQGEEGLVVKVDFDIMLVERNGVQAMGPGVSGAGAIGAAAGGAVGGLFS